MSDKQRIKELEAMLVHLKKRVEKLEGKTRLAPSSTHLRELSNEASKLLSYWD